MYTYEIVMDGREKPQKCTVAPLNDRKDFQFIRIGQKSTLAPLESDLLLHVDGKPLDELDLENKSSLAVIDCQWRRCNGILERIEQPLPVLAKIPARFVTAYPRKSKDNSDPSGGLATIEAIFIAAAFMGHWDESLLEKYYFAEKFLETNTDNFKHYDIYKYR